MTSITSGSSSDRLTKLDEYIDSQIGGLVRDKAGERHRYHAGSPSLGVPQLNDVSVANMQDSVSNAENALIDFQSARPTSLAVRQHQPHHLRRRRQHRRLHALYRTRTLTTVSSLKDVYAARRPFPSSTSPPLPPTPRAAPTPPSQPRPRSTQSNIHVNVHQRVQSLHPDRRHR